MSSGNDCESDLYVIIESCYKMLYIESYLMYPWSQTMTFQKTARQSEIC